jgi:hypothetical protein
MKLLHEGGVRCRQRQQHKSRWTAVCITGSHLTKQVVRGSASEEQETINITAVGTVVRSREIGSKVGS